MIYPYHDAEIPGELAEKLRSEFREKYFQSDFYRYQEDGIGVEDVHKYPDTQTHRKLFPDLYELTVNYYKCSIARNFTGSWCGYVTYENNSIDEDQLSVHGGITFHNAFPLNQIGFDCNHAGDAHPFRSKARCINRIQALQTGQVWNCHVYCCREYVIGELEYLTRQLLRQLPRWSPQTHHKFPKLYRERMVYLYFLWYLDSSLKKLQTRHLWIKILSHLSDSERY